MEQGSLLSNCAEVAANCAGMRFRMASRLVTQIYDEAMQPVGLRATQFMLMVALELAGAEGPATIGRLAEALAMDRTTLARNLKPLEQVGLLRVEAGKDRRVREVTLTERGQVALAAGIPRWRAAQERVVSVLGAKRWEQLKAELDTSSALLR